MKDITQNSKKISVHYAAAFFIYFAAFCMVRSFISVYLLDRGFNYTQVGIITAVHMFISAAVQPEFSKILDRFPKLGLHRFITICCVPAIACSLITFVLPSRMIFFIPLYVLFGLFEIGLQSLMVSVGMEYVNAGIPVNLGLGRGMGSVGYAAANLLLGFLIVKFGSPVSHILNIVLMVLLAILIITLPDPGLLGAAEQSEEEKDEGPSDKMLTFLRGNHIFALFTLAEILLFFAHSILNTYLPNVAAQFGLGADFTGAANSLAAFLELIPMMFYTKISKKIPPMTLLYISAVFFSIKILTATLAKNAAGILLSETMQIAAYAVFSMASIYFTNQAVRPHNRVMAQGVLIGAGEIGFTIGSLIGGVVLDHYNIRFLLWMGVCVSVIGSAMMILAVTKFKRDKVVSQ